MASKNTIVLCVAAAVLLCVGAVAGIPIPDEDWDYVTVRPKAHMFWWLYGMKDAAKRESAPLVMWLQGGPGASSTGFGNFEEIGPIDMYGRTREHSWVNTANLLFVDNPVGSGFSYVEDSSAFTTTEEEIAADLVTLMQAFVSKYTQFQTLPFYIFSESYGGKMAASFAKALLEAKAAGKINVNFKAVALGDAWIRPMSFVNTWAPYLYATAEVDESGYQQIMKYANLTQQAVDQKQWRQATNLWGQTENVVLQVTAGIDFYNILNRGGSEARAARAKQNLGRVESMEALAARHLEVYHADPLSQFMNGPIRQKLGIIPSHVTWGGQSNDVFSHLSVDFMQDVTPTVDYLLEKGFPVVVYSGNLDLICCTMGTFDWMNTLRWNGYSSWKKAPNKAITLNGVVVGYDKQYNNLRVITLFASGHMLPSDQPAPAEKMLRMIVGYN